MLRLCLMTLIKSDLKAGAILWLYGIQYFIAQVVAASAWRNGFSWANNTISDLGNSACGSYNGAFVCSPRHTIMNVSFVLLGITMISGAFYLSRQFHMDRLVTYGFGCMALAGLGTILIGLFPENTVSGLHILGAVLPFVFGNIGMLLIGKYCTDFSRWLRLYGIASGLIGLVGLGLLLFHADFGLGNGTIERITAYPQTIWMIVASLYLLILQNRKNIT